MKIRFLFKYLIIFLIPLSMIQPVKADLASDLLKLAGDAAAKNKAEYAKWGLTSSKDIKKLKSKEIKLLLNGNVFDGNFNNNENQGKTKEIYYKDGTYKGTIAGQSETGKWYIKEGKLCYKGYPGCSKIYKSKSEPNVYYQKQQGIIFTKFNKVGSIEEVEKIKKAAKEKKLAKEKVAKEKKLAKEKVAKEKKLAKEKAAKEKKIAEEKAAKEKLEKKLSLLPAQTDLEKAKIFLNTLKSFVKLNPDEFDIIKVSEFLISTKPISEGNLDDVLKGNLELFKEFTNSSNEFVKYYETKELMRKDKEIEKIDQTIVSLEQNIKTLKEFLTNNSDSIYVAQWVGDMKKANDILNNANNYDELVNENKRLTNVIFDSQKIDKAKIDAKITIVDLKEYLKINLTSDLAPLIIEQVKSLERAIKKENLEDITSADKTARGFIFKQFEEPKLKAAKEERIAAEKKYEEFKKSPEGIKQEKERVKKEKERVKKEKKRLRIEKENEGIHFMAKMICEETKKGKIISEEEIGVWGAMGIASENLYYINETAPKLICKCLYDETKKAISLERTKKINALYKKDKKADGIMNTREQNFFASLPRQCALPIEKKMEYWMKGGRP